MKLAASIVNIVAIVARARDHPSSAAGEIARAIVAHSKECFSQFSNDEAGYGSCAHKFCNRQCAGASTCEGVCVDHATPLFAKFSSQAVPAKASLTQADSRAEARAEARAAIQKQIQEAAGEQAA